jgi:hypothetical protein
MANRHSPGLNEAQCDDISERTAMFVLKQTKSMISGAALREMQARQRAGQTHIDPFYIYAGSAAGILTGLVSTMWSLMDEDATPAVLADLFHQLVDVQVAEIAVDPPGSLTKGFQTAEDQRKRKMT